MSLDGLRIITERFLSTPHPEVLCIRGAWGIGKTYAWKQAIDHVRTTGSAPLDTYAYVSLFGLSSLDELKQGIFDNSVVKKSAGLNASIETFDELVDATIGLSKWFRHTASTAVGSIAAHTGAATKFVGNVGPALFLSVRNRIVCIDDLERRGDKLKVGDVLGLISMLKEQRDCKVVLLLNDQAIDGKERDDFDAYLEKVVDVSFNFNPTPEDTARIVFPDRTGIYAKTAELCIKLSIRNIRILGKIKRFIDELAPYLSDFDKSLLDQAVSTIVLLCWAVFDPANAPPLTYLKTRNAWDVFLEETKKKLKPEELAWESVLQAYGFGHFDDLDNALLDGIQNGLFDPAQIRKVAADLHASVVAKNSEAAFHDAWRPYRESFDDNEDALLDGLYTSFKDNFRHISPTNLSGTVALFKELGRPEQAAELLALYATNVVDPKLVDMESYFWASEIKDPDVIAAFRIKHEELSPEPDPVSAFLDLIERRQYNTDKIRVVAKLASSDFERILRSLQGDALRNASVFFSELSSINYVGDAEANRIKQQVTTAISDALDAISLDGELNKRRVQGLFRN